MRLFKLALRKIIYGFFVLLNPLIPVHGTRLSQSPVTLKLWFFQKILGFNRKAYWPVHPTSVIGGPENILIGVDAAAGISPGCYIQGSNKVIIGDYTQIGPNVGIISSNHKISNYLETISKKIRIGDYCWIGMNSVILPGVNLGDFTVVAAGSVVNESFEEGYCLIAGSPAKIIKKINKSECVKYKDDHEFIGYFKKNTFLKKKKKIINDFN